MLTRAIEVFQPSGE